MDIKVENLYKPKESYGLLFPVFCWLLSSSFSCCFSISSLDFLSPHLLSNFLFYLRSLASFVTQMLQAKQVPGGEKAGWVDQIVPLPSLDLCHG